jgi:hypothetical protein
MPKQRLTKRGKIVLGIALVILIWFVATRLWWTGTGFCVGDVVSCVIDGGK